MRDQSPEAVGIRYLRWLRRRARELLALGANRYGYALVREGGDKQLDSRADPSDFELIPRGCRAPFSTAEYDVLPKGGFDIVPHNYYSPIPDLSRLRDDIWVRHSDLGGVEMNLESGIDFVEIELARFIDELEVPLEDPGTAGTFFLRNSGFESVDAELLYAMVRHARPARIVELGSGYTSLLINVAARRNAADGSPTRHVAYDPYPREHVLGGALPDPTRLEAISATDVPLGIFEELEAGDILFVDTTHTVKLGSDVNFVVLDVLPRLRPGVLVHFHDIFLPWEYPRIWFEQMQYYWAEQYLLQGFLAFNRDFAVLVPAHALAREYPQRLGQVIPSFRPGVMPGSLWMRCNTPHP